MKELFPLTTLVQLEMHVKILYQVNARNNHVAENFQFIKQSTFLGLLTGENCIGVGTIFQA